MKCVLEKAESHWALRFLGARHEVVRRFQLTLAEAMSIDLTNRGYRPYLELVRLVPQGKIHHYGNVWAMTICTSTKQEARQILRTIYSLLEATPHCRRTVWGEESEDEVTELSRWSWL